MGLPAYTFLVLNVLKLLELNLQNEIVKINLTSVTMGKPRKKPKTHTPSEKIVFFGLNIGNWSTTELITVSTMPNYKGNNVKI